MREQYIVRGSEALNRAISLPDRERELRRVPKRRQRKQEGQGLERYADIGFASQINLFSFVLLMGAVFGIGYMSIGLLTVSDKITSMNRETDKVFAMVKQVKSENDNKENKIYSQIDLEEIREKALTELGMVYPYRNHVISYKAVSGGYVRQFGEIQRKDNLSFFEKILSRIISK